MSEVGFGCARIGGVFGDGKSGAAATMRVLRQAADAGINFFDTADMYAQGESEALLGRAFRKDRDKVILATKGGYCLPAQRKLVSRIKPLVKPLIKMLGIKRSHLPQSVSGALSQDFSPAYLTRALEASLRRMGTDYIDLYQLHSPPAEIVERAESIQILEKLKTEGKVRHYGVACDSAADAQLCLKHPEIAALQFPFGLLDQEALVVLFPAARERGIALIARGSFGGGLLKESLTEADLQQMTEKWPRVLAYRSIANRQRRNILEAALQFSLHPKSISVTLLGMRTERHLQNNLLFHSAPPLAGDEFETYARG